VVDRDIVLGSTLVSTAMRVPVHDKGNGETGNRLLETTGAGGGINLEWFALDRLANGRVVQQHNLFGRAQACERGFELERFVTSLVHELLYRVSAPRAESGSAESACEAFDARDPDAIHLARFAIEHGEPGVTEDVGDLFLATRFEVVVAEDSHAGDSQHRQLAREHSRFLRLPRIREITGEQDHI